jgi:hypothetical protein|nr:MAG TPA: hypothetical protein [Caudoviricetes sp.]DAS11402.1 MAG TPA: hypothetical protein [Caudoviricetes sp.]
MKTIYKVNDVEVHIRHFYKFIEGVNEMPFEIVKKEINEQFVLKFLEMGAGKADKIVVEIYGESCLDVTYWNGDKNVLFSTDTSDGEFYIVDMNCVNHNRADIQVLHKALNELAASNPDNATLKQDELDARKINAALNLFKKFNVITIEYHKGGNDVFHVEFDYTPTFAEAVEMGIKTQKHDVMLVGYGFFVEEFKQSHPDSVLQEANK